MEAIIAKIESTPIHAGEHLELEARTRMNSDTILKIIDSTTLDDSMLSQTLDVIRMSKDANVIRTHIFKNGKTLEKVFRFKKRLASTIIKKINDWKLALSHEGPDQPIHPSSDDIMRLKYRLSIPWSQSGPINPKHRSNWLLDITIAIDVDASNVAAHVANVFNRKTIQHFKSVMSQRSGTHEVEIELQYREKMDPEIYSQNAILDMLSNIDRIADPSLFSEHEAQSLINEIHKMMFSTNAVEHDRRPKTLKAISNQVVPIKHEDITTIIETPSQYFITDKADGERAFIYIKDKVLRIVANRMVIEHDVSFDGIYLFDAEYVGEKIYVFDVLYFANKAYYLDSFEQRIEMLPAIKDLSSLLSIKTHVRLSEDIKTPINFIKSRKLPYGSDGYIITPNEQYYSTVYKLKHTKDITIDFYCITCPKVLHGKYPFITRPGKTLYILFNGVSRRTFETLAMSKIPQYNEMIVHPFGEYFPIQFSPSSNPHAYLFYDERNLHDKIVELHCSKMPDYGSAPDWQLYRIRTDRSAGKGYFGNDFRVAESVWESYSNPITLDMFIDAKSGMLDLGYFKVHANPLYKAMRTYNSIVKSMAIEQNAAAFAIDLAAGKGQDLNRYASAKFNRVLFTDVDPLALAELASRKYNMANPMIVNTLNVDISDKGASLKILNAAGSAAPLVSCQMSMHYFMKNETTAKQFVDLIDVLLAADGKFIVSAFDGERIVETLSGIEEWKAGDIYSIVKKYKGDTLHLGNEIDVMLPFSDGKHYREYLTDFNVLSEMFAMKKIKRVAFTHFDDFDVPAAHKNALSPHDKKFISHYVMAVYQKEAEKPIKGGRGRGRGRGRSRVRR